MFVTLVFLWLIRSVSLDPTYTYSIFVCGPSLILYWYCSKVLSPCRDSLVSLKYSKRSLKIIIFWRQLTFNFQFSFHLVLIRMLGETSIHPLAIILISLFKCFNRQIIIRTCIVQQKKKNWGLTTSTHCSIVTHIVKWPILVCKKALSQGSVEPARIIGQWCCLIWCKSPERYHWRKHNGIQAPGAWEQPIRSRTKFFWKITRFTTAAKT